MSNPLNHIVTLDILHIAYGRRSFGQVQGIYVCIHLICIEQHQCNGILTGMVYTQAFLSLQRVLDPTLDYLMRRQGSKTFSTEATEQMARELKSYLLKAIRS